MTVTLGLHTHSFVRNALINFHANAGNLSTASGLLFSSPAAKRDAVAWSSLVAGCANRGQLTVARQLFDQIPSKDLISYNIMITAYVKHGHMDDARQLFDVIPHRDVVSWNAMLTGYVQYGLHAKALKLFDEMCSAGEKPDLITMTSLLSSCAESGSLEVGERIHHDLLNMSRNSGVIMSTITGNALIDMYAKCGSIDEAVRVFRGMKERDASTWNSIIGGLALHGDAEASVALFKEMLETETKPDEITFVGVLVACSHGGMVEEGRRYFAMMTDEYTIEPNIKHCGCMVDMLSRAGILEEAFEFIEVMKIEPNPIIWRTLLGACKNYGHVELGKRANEELQKLRQDASEDYVLLSNIYASVGEWGGVEKVRKMMDQRGLVKEAGQALLEADDKDFMHFLLREVLGLIRRAAFETSGAPFYLLIKEIPKSYTEFKILSLEALLSEMLKSCSNTCSLACS